jgi:mercuric ion binding protein
MKMKRISALILVLLFFTSLPVSANDDEGPDQEVTFTVDKMTCATCPITVRKAMQRVDGVKEVTVDFDTKTATVIYDASRTNAKQIGEASGNVGFPATAIEANTQ